MIRKIITPALCLLMAMTALAQLPDRDRIIPDDPDVIKGKLSNGLTYYIRHNPKPGNLGQFYIYHNVGAIQEEDSQQGLAHFLEHMAFNGSDHFPGNMMTDYLEKVGVKFGANLNAATGQEMTYYMMADVPLRDGVIDTALLILHDWSFFLTLSDEMVEKERGVIIEELRQGYNADFRLRLQTDPILYNESKYAYRNIIGNEELLRSFSPNVLRDFYHRWYRTDQQTIVVVGDFDARWMERKVIELFADIPAVENPDPKVPVYIPDNDQPLIAVATDPELTSSMITFVLKHPARAHELNNTVGAYIDDYLSSIITSMANLRLSEIAQQSDAPFLQAGAGYGNLTTTAEIFQGRAMARNGETARAFGALYTEVERMRRYGFTESELELVRTNFLRSAEMGYDQRDDRRSSDFVWDYIGNFSQNDPIPSAEVAWTLDSTILNNITLEDVNRRAAQIFRQDNEVVLITSPRKDEIEVPTEQQIRTLMAQVRSSEIEAPADKSDDRPLLSYDPQAGTVVSREEGQFESTVLKLSNGATVVLKPTTFKSDEILMSVSTGGGFSNLTDEEYRSARILPSFIREAGAGEFSSFDLGRKLAGKGAKIGVSIGHYENGFSGSSSVKDLETLFQLTNLYFVNPRFQREDFDRMADRLGSQLYNSENTPDFVLRDSLTRAFYQDDPRRNQLRLQDLATVDFSLLEPAYRKLYGNASNFTFTFVGSFTEEDIVPLIEKYIASLPADGPRLESKDDGVRTVPGYANSRFTYPMETPKSTVIFMYSGPIGYRLEFTMGMSVLRQILDLRYTEKIREEKGGTYGVGVSANVIQHPFNNYVVQIYFDTDPAMVDELSEIVQREIQLIADEGPQMEDLRKVLEYMVKVRADGQTLNTTWLNYLDRYYVAGIDLNTNWEDTLKYMNPLGIQRMAQKLIQDGNRYVLQMFPEE